VQVLDEVAPRAAEYVPAAQSVQVLDANAEYWPTPQLVQAVDPVGERYIS
jgi:hypothetical protein